MTARAASLPTGPSATPDLANGELLQHCGPWPLSVAGCRPCITYPLAFDYPGAITAEAKHGDLTLARFDGDNGEYSLLLGNAKGVDGPDGHGHLPLGRGRQHQAPRGQDR